MPMHNEHLQLLIVVDICHVSKTIFQEEATLYSGEFSCLTEFNICEPLERCSGL